MVASKPTFDGVSAAKERTFVLIPWDFPTLQAPQRTSCAFAGGVGHPRRLEIPGSRKLDWGRPPMSTIRTAEAPFCTSSAPCEGAFEGLPLDGGTGIGPGPEICPGLSAKQTARLRARQGRLRLSTGKWRCLESRCAKYQQNTRCCGLLLTRTMDSGIFSSAAVNGL